MVTLGLLQMPRRMDAHITHPLRSGEFCHTCATRRAVFYLIGAWTMLGQNAQCNLHLLLYGLCCFVGTRPAVSGIVLGTQAKFRVP